MVLIDAMGDSSRWLSVESVVQFRSWSKMLTNKITDDKQDCHFGHIILQGEALRVPMLKNNEWIHLI